MLHSNFPATKPEKATMPRDPALARRIENLRNRPTDYIGHGEALLLQGIATASLRAQHIAGTKITLDD